jgi:hypothetical protein
MPSVRLTAEHEVVRVLADLAGHLFCLFTRR